MAYDGPLALSDVGLSPAEIDIAQLTTPEEVGDPHHCAVCRKTIEPDGFCAWHGPLLEQWLCDTHVHELRMRGQELRPKEPMTREKVEHAIGTMELALKNMAMIDGVSALDASGAWRGFELSLTWKQSRPIIKAILEVLKIKLTAFPPPATIVTEVDPD